MKRGLEKCGGTLRITCCKMQPNEESRERIKARQVLSQEVLKALGSVKGWAPKDLLKAPCFHKDSDTVEYYEELEDLLVLTANGQKWLTAAKLEKMDCLRT